MFRNTRGFVHTQPFNYLGHYACKLLNTIILLPFILFQEHCNFHISKTLTDFLHILLLSSEGLLNAQINPISFVGQESDKSMFLSLKAPS